MMKRSHDVTIDEKVAFDSLIQNKELIQGLLSCGYEVPSPVQLKAIPLGRLGVDLIAQAKSGTGKTVVFSVIALEAINTAIRFPQVIIMAPTREIAVQIRDVVRHLGALMHVKCHAFIGGLSLQSDAQHLTDCHVIVGTPGRLMALLEAKKVNTTRIRLVVLDEADKMMSDTFQPQVDYILRKLKQKVYQSIAFSATFTEELMQSLSKYLKNPQTVRLTDGVPTLQEVQQYYVPIEPSATSTIAVYKCKFEAVERLLSRIPFYQCMVFVNQLSRSSELSSWLNEMGWKSGHIHAGLSQQKRLEVMDQMRHFGLRVLVCSDLIARGIDIDRVNLVINVDLPWEIETYLHRVGRTGRYGTSGIAVNLIGPEDTSFLKALQEKGIQIKPLPDQVSYNEYVKELTKEDQKALEQHRSLIIEVRCNVDI
ncbi:P-loop containing nucleoside triphosphate hydrolase protein [Blakeslea trispora]|nr:P-loop containing nucleoside triphosphate hydrolase protein [Blakeslea trispora]